jgi:hypothetical protein
VTLLLREGGRGERAEYLADVVLAPLGAIAFAYHRHGRRFSLTELEEAHADLCRRLLDSTR